MKKCTNLIQSLAKTLLITLLCTFGVGEMEASLYIVGDEALTGHEWQAGDWGDRKADASVTFYAVSAGDHYFRVAADDANFDTDYNVSTNTGVCGTLSGTVSGGTASGKSVKITLSEISDVTFTRQGETWTYDVHGNASCYFIKYKWDGTNYTYSGMMVSNLDGTYSVSGHYHGLSYNHARRGSDGGAGGGWHENGATIVGETPDEGDNCIFTLKPEDDYSLTIRKCNTVNLEDDRNSYMYFDNDADWTGTNRYFVIGRPETSKVYQMYPIANTKLWYIPDGNKLDKWDDCGYYGIVVNSTAWSNGGWGPDNLPNADQHYTTPYLTPQNLDSKYYYIIKKENNTNAITFEKKTMSYSCLNLTVGYKYNLDGVDMTSGGVPAQITMTSYYFSSNRFTTSSNEEQTITANSTGTYTKSVSCAYRGNTTLTVSNLNNGYMFKGWYDGETKLSSNASYTFYPDANTTVTAKFETRWTVAGSWKTLDESTAWDPDYYLMGTITKEGDDDVCSIDIDDLSANTTYRFKIVDRNASPYSWYGYGTSQTDITYTTENLPWTLETGEGNTAEIGLQTAAAGTYTFVWNITQHKLTVSYPTSYHITMAMNPNTGGSTITPTGTFWVGTDAFDIVATPNYSHYFGGWTSSDGGSFGDHTAATTTFTATANTTLTASMPEYSVFVEGRFEVLSSSGESITVGGADAVNNSIAIKMDYDATNNRYFRRTYSAPQELAKRGTNDAYFYFRTSELDNSLRGGAMYYANKYTTLGDNNLSVAGFENARGTKLGNDSRGFLFTGTEEANVILYFDGTNVWYETEEANTFTDDSNDHKWSTASNWSSGTIPVITDMVSINKPVTVDIAHATAKRIILDQHGGNTGKLTIQANKGLEVLQTIKRTTDGSNRLATRTEDLILESSSSGNASLIFDNNNSDAATVHMYSKASISGDTWNWQFMGTPFTSANALYSYYGAYLYEWQSTGTWDAVANGGTMTAFTGYCITQDDPTTYVMDGTLNPTSSDKAISIPAGLEFVMANSWTAPISVCNFTNTTLPLDNQTIYLFNTGHAESDASAGSAAGTYIAMPINSAVYTGNYLIAPMEGFYVNNIGGSAVTVTLKYDELVRPSGSHTDIVAGAMHAPKRVDVVAEPDVMKIKAIGSRYADRVVILARPDFSAGFDNGWDGKNLNEPGVAPIIYALRADGTKDAVSAIPTFEGTVVGFRLGEDNQYTFSFEYDGEDIWYLNDLKQQTSTLIDAEHSYSFSTAADDAEARFIISATPIANMPTGCGQIGAEAEKVKKVIINDQLYIIHTGRMYNAVGSIVK